MNGGTCVQDARPNFRECTCVTGYIGLDCETGKFKAAAWKYPK